MKPYLIVCYAITCMGCLGPGSKISATSAVIVQGQVFRQSGTPYYDATTLLIQHPDLIQAAADVIASVGSLGLYCLNQNDTLCHAFETTATHFDGTFEFPTFEGAQSQGPTGDALLFTTWISGPNPNAPYTAPSAIQSDFYIQDNNTVIPTLTLWEATVNVANAGGNVVFTWTGPVAGASNQVVITNTDGNQTFWQASTNGNSTGTAMDPRVTQDFQGTWGVTAVVTQSAANTTFNTTLFAPRQIYPNQHKIPLSRNTKCYQEGSGGPVAVSPCPLTDGQMGTQLVPYQCGASDANCSSAAINNWVYVDLTRSQTLTELILYDLAANFAIGDTEPQLIVESSPDATTWTQVGAAAAAPYQVVPLSGSGRYVRLRLSPTDGTFTASGNSEIAIF